MTMRKRYEAALDEWTDATAALRIALSDFMDDGVRTRDGLWLLSMCPSKAETLHVARRRVDAARTALDAIVDHLVMPQAGGVKPERVDAARIVRIRASVPE